MNIVTHHIKCNGEKLIITNQRAVYWEREKMLIISDIHIGKTGHFRKNGIPITTDVMAKDLERLENLFSFFQVKHLMVVGDLFHAKYNSEFDFFKNWLDQFKGITKTLIKGNHDKISNQIAIMFSDWNIVSQLEITPFTFVHDYDKNEQERFQISGHIHPGVFIKGKGRQRIKLPCYQVSKKLLILPAFSLFTGLNVNKPLKEGIHYAFTKEAIFKV